MKGSLTLKSCTYLKRANSLYLRTIVCICGHGKAAPSTGRKWLQSNLRQTDRHHCMGGSLRKAPLEPECQKFCHTNVLFFLPQQRNQSIMAILWTKFLFIPLNYLQCSAGEWMTQTLSPDWNSFLEKVSFSVIWNSKFLFEWRLVTLMSKWKKKKGLMGHCTVWKRSSGGSLRVIFNHSFSSTFS